MGGLVECNAVMDGMTGAETTSACGGSPNPTPLTAKGTLPFNDPTISFIGTAQATADISIMPFISSLNLIRANSVFHLTLAYYFLTNPSIILHQTPVWILGESMGLPHPTLALSIPSPSLSFLATLFALHGITDLAAVLLPEEISFVYWNSQASLRAAFFFLVTGYVYIFKPGGIAGAMKGSGQGEEGLKNSVIFTWGFLEIMAWVWIYATLKDEGRELAKRLKFKREIEEERRM